MSASDYSQNPAGFWMKNSDGSGPYVRASDGTFTLAGTGSGSGGGGGAATIADGADVTQGAIADAVVAAGAAGTLSAKLRRLTTDLGTLIGSIGAKATAAAQAVSIATDDALLGTAADAAVAAGAAGTVSAKLRRFTTDLGTLVGAIGSKATAAALAVSPATDSANFPITSTGRKVRTAVTRPANVTPYTANDVVGGAIDLGVLGAASGHVMITSVDLIHEVAAIPSGMTSFRLYLYSATPPSAVADNGAFDLAAGDLTSYIGYVELGVLVDLGSNLFVQVDNVNKHVVCDASGHLFGYLVTNGGWTPGANSTVFDITMRTAGL